jgi:hypothetical protein
LAVSDVELELACERTSPATAASCESAITDRKGRHATHASNCGRSATKAERSVALLFGIKLKFTLLGNLNQKLLTVVCADGEWNFHFILFGVKHLKTEMFPNLFGLWLL